MNNLIYLVFTVFLFLISYIYFRIARAFKIVDLPNHRTMHDGATIRGGGVVVWVGMLVYTILFYNPGYLFLIGIALIGLTGLLDDLIDLSSKIRFPFQFISIALILGQLDLFGSPGIWLILTLIVATGILNAFNFMDGINGMTAGYSLIFTTTLIYFNYFVEEFIPIEFLYGYFLALLVFSYFNFRNKAVFFAGDVGSLTIAYINVFLLLKLMVQTESLVYLFFFTVYGIDTIFTIIQRLIKKENIFEAHKLHLFQEVVSHTKITHLQMTGIYMFVQVLINIIIVFTLKYSILYQWLIIFVILSFLSVIYVWVKIKLVSKIYEL